MSEEHKAYPTPWEYDYFPHQCSRHSYATLYAADHSRIGEVRGPDSDALARDIIECVNAVKHAPAANDSLEDLVPEFCGHPRPSAIRLLTRFLALTAALFVIGILVSFAIAFFYLYLSNS